MLAYVLRRLMLMSITLVGISMVTFLIVSLAPGDRLSTGATMDPGTLASEKVRIAGEQKKLYGLDKPMYQRYLIWLWRTVRLDFGESWSVRKGEKVVNLIWARMGPTVQMNIVTMFLVYLIAVPWGLCRR